VWAVPVATRRCDESDPGRRVVLRRLSAAQPFYEVGPLVPENSRRHGRRGSELLGSAQPASTAAHKPWKGR